MRWGLQETYPERFSLKEGNKAIGKLNDVALTSTGSLYCCHIIYVLLPGDIFECKKVVRATLRLSASQKYITLAIPMIGVSLGNALEEMAACITDEVATETRNGNRGSLTSVNLEGCAFKHALKLSAANSSALDALMGNITSDAVKVDSSQNYFICDLQPNGPRWTITKPVVRFPCNNWTRTIRKL